MVSSAAAGGIAGGGGAYPRRVSGTLILCAGPIGNLGDTSARLSEVLRSADIVYAEDTRRSAVLLDRLDARRPLRSFFVGNEKVRSAEIAQHLQAGETVALLTDAGMPGISDPGLSAVRAAVSVGANVTGIPGPSAVTLALALSGLPADRFVFEGFLPRRGGERSRRLDDLASEPRTSVVFCSPRRLAADVADLTARLGRDRPVVVCREMTKLHEEVWRGSLGEAAEAWSEREARGEVTIVVGGAPRAEPDLNAAITEAEMLIDGGMTVRSATRQVADERSIRRREIYEAIVARRGRAE